MDVGVWSLPFPQLTGLQIFMLLLILSVMLATVTVTLESLIKNDKKSGYLYATSIIGVGLIGIAMIFLIGLGIKRQYESGWAGILHAMQLNHPILAMVLLVVFGFLIAYFVLLFQFSEKDQDTDGPHRYLYIMSIVLLSITSALSLLLLVGITTRTIRGFSSPTPAVSSGFTFTSTDFTMPTSQPTGITGIEGLGLETLS